MGTLSAITIANGEGTPVNYTFNPLYASPGRTTYVNRDSETSAGSMKIDLAFSASSRTRNTDRVKVAFSMPIEEETEVGSGVYRVVDTARFNGDWVLPSSLTAANRADLEAFVANLVTHAVVDACIADLDPPY